MLPRETGLLRDLDRIHLPESQPPSYRCKFRSWGFVGPYCVLNKLAAGSNAIIRSLALEFTVCLVCCALKQRHLGIFAGNIVVRRIVAVLHGYCPSRISYRAPTKFDLHAPLSGGDGADDV